MMPTRRAILGLMSAGMALPSHLVQAQALPTDTARIQREIEEATRRGRPWIVPPGLTLAGTLRLPDGAHLVGARGRSRILHTGSGPLVIAEKVQTLTLEGIVLDGGVKGADRTQGLVQLREVGDLRIEGCTIQRFGGNGLHLERCRGRVLGNSFHDNGRAALFALDSRGLVIDGNVVERSAENGILVWRSAKGDDGTIVRSNRILDTRSDAGGTGQYGNAIGLFRAGGVIVEGNVIRRAAFTAVRNNSGSNITVAGNNIAGCGEVALYSEFGFDGTVITGNIVDGSLCGIQVTNFADHGGRLASVTGNLIRNTKRARNPSTGETGGGQAIFVEGDAVVSGNIVDGADKSGLQLGWGPSLRDVTASGNTLRDCLVGIEISVAPDAGHATVVGNTISGARTAAILGMRWQQVATGDLAVTGAKDWPKIRLAENTVR
jgi:uncharacterized secreted repeat protein (TIGR03808 family)